MVEIVPEPLGVEEMQLLLLVAEERAQPRIVEDEPPLLVDEAETGRAVLQELAELALLLGDLRLALAQRRDVVDPQDALAADEADVTAAVGDLGVGDQHMDERPCLVFQTASSSRSSPPRSRSLSMIRARWSRSCQNRFVSKRCISSSS